jgi:cephalosporin hydroxylase
MSDFEKEVRDRVASYANNRVLRTAAQQFLSASIAAKYSYNFGWLARPIIQYPQDIVGMQELIWQVKPDLIIETGIAHGGSLIFNASMLALIDYCEASATGGVLDPALGRRCVLGLDIDIRAHNRVAIETHPLAHKINMIEGSSIDPAIVARVKEFARGYDRIIVSLDSNHTHDHVLSELEAYAPLTSNGSYCVVFDTVIEHLPTDDYSDRPWGSGNNPMTAVREYLRRLESEGRKAIDGAPLRFQADLDIDDKLLISVGPGGYLRRVDS